MKIMHLVPELNAGGVERAVFDLTQFLIDAGQTVQLVSNGGQMVPGFEKLGATHHQLPVHRKSLASLVQVRRLRRLLSETRPDVLHLHSRVPAWIGWLARRSMATSTRPHLVTTVHGFYSTNFYSAIMTRGERVIAVSESIRDYILRHYPRTPASAIRVIPNGLDLRGFPRGFQPTDRWRQSWHEEHPTLKDKSILLLPGRLTRLKGHGEFLRLIASLRRRGLRVHGFIVGDVHHRKHSYRDELRELAARLGVQQDITFTGHRSDLREVMAVSQIVFSLSTKPESFGLTTLEALALGRPVIAYDHGGVGEQLRRILPAGRVPLRDAAALVETTRRMLSSPEVPGPIPSDYTLEASCQSTLETYRELCREAG